MSTRDPSAADAGARHAIPLVTLGFAPSRNANIVLDKAAGAARALHHLARIGHRRIAIISEPTDWDPFLSAASAARATARAVARTVALEGAGHWWMLQDPARAAAVLREFWATLA